MMYQAVWPKTDSETYVAILSEEAMAAFEILRSDKEPVFRALSYVISTLPRCSLSICNKPMAEVKKDTQSKYSITREWLVR